MKYTDQEIIDAIREGEQRRGEMVKYLFQLKDWKQVAYVHAYKWKGDESDVNIIFTDSMITFYQRISEIDFRYDGSVKTYFGNIIENTCRNYFRKKRNKNKPQVSSYEVERVEESTEQDDHRRLKEAKAQQLLKSLLENFGKGCVTVGILYWKGYSHKEIAEQMGLSADEQSRKKYSRCIKKIREYLRDNNLNIRGLLHDE